MTEPPSSEAVTIDVGPDGAIVVSGEIDMAGGPLVEAAANAPTNPGHVVIDLAGVSFIDSSGLRSLLAVSRAADARGSSVTLRGVGPEVARLLEITGTAGLFGLEERT
jgi:anti-sigma B factor antagonist